MGSHHGKSRGKLIGSILVGVASAFIPGAFGVAGHAFNFGRFMLGASLFSSVWSATHRAKQTGNLSINRFDRAQETASGQGDLPVVYGERMISGNQTFHETDADAQTLHKHVVLCEGGIQGLVSVTAGDLLIPTNNETQGTVFTVQNLKYSDATFRIKDKHIYIHANGKDRSFYLCNEKDTSGSYYSYQVTVSSLITYINSLGEGWQAFPTATTSKYPGDCWTEAQANSNVSTYTEVVKPKDAPHGVKKGTTWTDDAFFYEIIDSYFVPLQKDDLYFRLTIKKSSLARGEWACYKDPIKVKCDTVKGGTKYYFHDCETPGNYEKVGGYPMMAWLDLTFTTASDFAGNPSISCVVKGRKVYDIRTGLTEYSTNPAMCLRDFILSERYGCGLWFDAEDLDEDSWAEAADYCDETITFLNGDGALVQAKRYELNIVIDTKRTALEWVQEILANFCGYLVYSDGKLKLKIEKQEPISYKFNDGNCFDLSIEPLKLSETPNRYEVSLIDPRNNWAAIKALCEDFADQKLRQRIVTKTVNLEGVTSQNQALRLARFYRDYNLVCPLQMSFKTGMQGMNLEPGDVVTITYHGVFTDMPIRIAEIKETENGTYEISGRQYNDTIYGDALGGGIHWYNYSTKKDLPTPSEYAASFKPDIPTNVKAETRYRQYADGSVGYELVVTYDLPQRFDTETGLVYYKHNNEIGEQIVFVEGMPADEAGYSSEWKYAGDSPTQCIIPDVKLGDIYKIKVLTRNTAGKTSNESKILTVKINPKATVPAMPTDLTYDFSESFKFMWRDVESTDAIYYEVVQNNKTIAKVTGLSAVVKLTKRKGTVKVYAVNTLGKRSHPATIDYNVPKPDAPVLRFQEVPVGCKVIANDFPSTVHQMKLKIAGNTQTITTSNYIYQGKAGIFDVSACYVDLFGDGNWSPIYQMTVKPTLDPSYIAEETITLNMVDKTLKEAVADAQEAIPRLDGIDTTLDGIDAEITGIKKTATDNLAAANKRADDNMASIETKLNAAPDVNGYKSIQDLHKADGELSSTIANNKKDADGKYSTNASLIKQNAGSIQTMVANLNASANGNAYKSISGLYQTAQEISSTVTANKESQDKTNESLSSQITQKADAITSTVTANKAAQDKTNKSLSDSITQVSQKADSISSTVSSNKTAQDKTNQSLSSQITQNADSVTAVIANLNATDPSKSAYKSITQLKADINGVSSTVASNKSAANASISQVSQKADNIKATIEGNLNATDPSKSAYKSITQLQANINGVSSTVQKNKSDTDTAISKVDQKADSISSTVQDYKTSNDKTVSGLSSKVTQNANSITSIVTNLGKAPKDSGYSAITQLQNAVNARVTKNDVINQINISTEGILIDGKKVHITGDTKFDNNVIVGGMIAANAITADKLSASTISLSDHQGIQGGAVTLDKNGLTVINQNGSYVTHNDQGMVFHDKNGGVFSMVGAMLTGIASDGQYVKFNTPWENEPSVLVVPTGLPTNAPGYGNANLYNIVRATDVSVNGFRVICRLILKSGSSGSNPINYTLYNNTNSTGKRPDLENTRLGTYSTTPPGTATHIDFTIYVYQSSTSYESDGDAGQVPHYGEGDNYLKLIANGSVIQSISLHTYRGKIDSTYHLSGDIPQNSNIQVVLDTVLLKYPTDTKVTIQSVAYNVQGDTVISTGPAVFLAINHANSNYTIT